MTSAADLADQLAAEAAGLELEIREIDLLVNQARTESGRHEARRAAAAEKLAGLGDAGTVKEAVDLANQVATVTRRAALMDAQLEILEGKRRSVARLQETLQTSAERVRGLGEPAATASPSDEGIMPPAVSRLVLTAQEDLRREIARAMHDGPAQSLTNIVLQAEIVERLVVRDPALAATEVRQLVGMVQHTLEATKAFIFDVRPMVLDDLGLVPTLRRSARDRGRRAGIVVDFESMGVDRRLPVELESGLFRIVDESLAAYLGARPDRVSIALDWAETLVATVTAERAARQITPLDIPEGSEALPPALAAMVADRRAQHDEAVDAAEKAARVTLPAQVERDLAQRAETLGLTFERLDDGAGLRVALVIPGGSPDADEPEPGGA